MCKIDSSWEAAIKHRELGSVLCDDLGRGDGGGRGICIRLVYFIVQQKQTKHCKAITLQLKKIL